MITRSRTGSQARRSRGKRPDEWPPPRPYGVSCKRSSIYPVDLTQATGNVTKAMTGNE